MSDTQLKTALLTYIFTNFSVLILGYFIGRKRDERFLELNRSALLQQRLNRDEQKIIEKNLERVVQQNKEYLKEYLKNLEDRIALLEVYLDGED